MKHQIGRTILAASALTVLVGGSALVMTLQKRAGAQKQPEPTGKITPWAAIKIATGKVPGRPLNANFEFDEGHWVYGVMVVTSSSPRQIKEVEIDPTTGKIGDVEAVTPNGEAKEMQAELNKALGNAAGKATKETDEKDEKNEKQ